MPLLDRCIFIPNTDGGTADFQEGTVVTGYQSMEAAGAINGQTYSYVAQSADLSQWEVGVGTYVSATKTLQRTTIQYNSSGTTAKINFLGSAPQVMLTALASDFVASAGGIVINTTSISGGTPGDVVYDNSGTVGEATLSALIDSNFGSSQGDILYRGSAGWTVLTPGTSGYVLKTQGAAANPQWAAAGAITVGTTTITSGTPGDLVYDNSGVVGEATLSALLDSNFASAQGDILYRGSGGWAALGPGTSGNFLKTQGASANPTWAATPAATLTVGSTTISGGTPGDVLYDNSGVVGEETLSALIDAAIGSTQGDILYRGSSVWSVLAPGSSGQFLKSQGASANPAWAASTIAVGTALSGGTNGDIVYDNNGAVGEATLTALMDTNLGSTQGDILYRSSSVWTVLAPGTSGYVLQSQGAAANPHWTTVSNGLVASVEFVIDGGGSVLTTGVKGYLEVPFGATINRVTLLGDQSGSVVVDIWKCTYSAFSPPTHPAVGDSITASDVPTISSSTKYQDSTLTGWTTTITAGDILAFDVVSVTTITRVTVSLEITRS